MRCNGPILIGFAGTRACRTTRLWEAKICSASHCDIHHKNREDRQIAKAVCTTRSRMDRKEGARLGVEERNNNQGDMAILFEIAERSGILPGLSSMTSRAYGCSVQKQTRDGTYDRPGVGSLLEIDRSARALGHFTNAWIPTSGEQHNWQVRRSGIATQCETELDAGPPR